MQLKSSPAKNLRAALSAATCTLLGSPVALADSDVSIIESGQFEGGYLYYSEKDRIDVDKVFVKGKMKIADDEYAALRLVHDSVSGASPSGATPVQSRTSASGYAPLVQFDATRQALGLDWEKPLRQNWRLNLSGDYSTEEGYDSLGSALTLSVDTHQRNTTWSAGLGYTRDTIEPEDGIPEELICLCLLPERKSHDHKTVSELQIGITQVLGRHTLAQIALSQNRTSGYLSNPYKVISQVHPLTGETLNLLPLTEKRPDERVSHIAVMQLNHYLADSKRGDVVYLSLRYFSDDWDIDSTTIDLKYRYQWNSVFYLQPHLRYYQQTAASFYQHTLSSDASVNYASADHRLNKMSSQSWGIKAGYRLAHHGELSGRIERSVQRGDNHPDNAIGVQKQADFFPEISASIVHLGYRITF